MSNQRGLVAGVILALSAGGLVLLVHSAAGENPNAQPPQRPRDAIAEAQTPRDAPAERPEQRKTAHDLSDIFTPSKATPSSGALIDQPEHGGMTGFDFYRDPLGALKPGMTFEDIYKAGVAG
ncbi:MAG: cytochrome B6, partial [Isosphaeraceae bacterium]